jgi:hypothetical protein
MHTKLAMVAAAIGALTACAQAPTPKVHDAAWLKKASLKLAYFPPAMFESALEPSILQSHLEHDMNDLGYGNSMSIHPQPGKTSWSESAALEWARTQQRDAVVLCTVLGEKDAYVPDRDAKDAISAPIPDRRDYPFRDGTGAARGPAVTATLKILRVSDGAVVYEMTVQGTPADSESALATALLQWLNKVE